MPVNLNNVLNLLQEEFYNDDCEESPITIHEVELKSVLSGMSLFFNILI